MTSIDYTLIHGRESASFQKVSTQKQHLMTHFLYEISHFPCLNFPSYSIKKKLSDDHQIA